MRNSSCMISRHGVMTWTESPVETWSSPGISFDYRRHRVFNRLSRIIIWITNQSDSLEISRVVRRFQKFVEWPAFDGSRRERRLVSALEHLHTCPCNHGGVVSTPFGRWEYTFEIGIASSSEHRG